MKTDKYIPTTYDREKNGYIEEYFSGPDVKIEINGEEFKGISSIQFSMQEQLKPLYSYASAVFNDIAVGNRIVTGSLIVPLLNDHKNYEFPSVTSFKDTSEDTTINNRPGWANNIRENGSIFYLSKKGYNTSQNNSYSLKTNLSYSDDIEKAQKILLELGYKVYINGYLDVYTADALMQYQIKNNLNITGALDNETKQSLFDSKYNYTNSVINVYIGPSSNYKCIGTIQASTPIRIITQIGDYSYITTADQKTIGYIPTNAIR